MGNTASCTPYRWPAAASAPVVKVVDRNGCISVHGYSRGRRRQQQPMGPSTAAELMLDYPGLFVCDSSRLEVGCRISGLPTDEELKPSHLYFLLPMNLLYSVLTEEEMVSFSCKPPPPSSKRRKSYLGRKFFPALSELCSIPSEAVVEEEEQASGADRTDEGEVSRLRWWRPALDTIEEDQ